MHIAHTNTSGEINGSIFRFCFPLTWKPSSIPSCLVFLFHLSVCVHFKGRSSEMKEEVETNGVKSRLYMYRFSILQEDEEKNIAQVNEVERREKKTVLFLDKVNVLHDVISLRPCINICCNALQHRSKQIRIVFILICTQMGQSCTYFNLTFQMRTIFHGIIFHPCCIT